MYSLQVLVFIKYFILFLNCNYIPHIRTFQNTFCNANSGNMNKIYGY